MVEHQKRTAGNEMGTQVNLPISKAIEISFNSVKIRFGRSLITVSGIVLSIAFLMSIWTTTAVVDSLKGAGNKELNLILQQIQGHIVFTFTAGCLIFPTRSLRKPEK